jgi:hypothetical protein
VKLQIDSIKKEIDRLQKKHGHKDYVALYGAGCIKNPKVMFLFMNPTAKNLTVRKSWKGMRAPWIGLKNTWKLMNKLGFISDKTNELIQNMKTIEWDNKIVESIYSEIAKNKSYLTNLARCTQPDARHVPDLVFRESRDITIEEIKIVNPEIVIAFGNQVSSNLLQRDIKVSEWRKKKVELSLGNKRYSIYPTYYPVGMGLRNINKAIEDIRKILGK